MFTGPFTVKLVKFVSVEGNSVSAESAVDDAGYRQGAR